MNDDKAIIRETATIAGSTLSGTNAAGANHERYMHDASRFDEDYFMRGQELGISGYTSYSWKPELTIPMAARIACHCDMKPGMTVLDFGCARGYTVRALRSIGYQAWGYDVSQWALANADEKVKEFLVANESALFGGSFEWVIAKDVLEHIEDIDAAVNLLMEVAVFGVFAVVPLAKTTHTVAFGGIGSQYDVPEYENDVTHIHRRDLAWWVGQFHRPGWVVTGQYRVPGVKDNYSQYPTGNGFITARRIDG